MHKCISTQASHFWQNYNFTITMDISTISTVCSIYQLGMSQIQKWAEDKISRGRKQDVIDLLTALPVLFELSDHSFSISDILSAWQKIHRIANVELGSLLRTTNFDFKKELDKQAKEFYTAISLEGLNPNLNAMAENTMTFMSRSGELFTSFQKSALVGESDKDSYQYLLYHQKRAFHALLGCVKYRYEGAIEQQPARREQTLQQQREVRAIDMLQQAPVVASNNRKSRAEILARLEEVENKFEERQKEVERELMELRTLL